MGNFTVCLVLGAAKCCPECKYHQPPLSGNEGILNLETYDLKHGFSKGAVLPPQGGFWDWRGCWKQDGWKGRLPRIHSQAQGTSWQVVLWWSQLPQLKNRISALCRYEQREHVTHTQHRWRFRARLPDWVFTPYCRGCKNPQGMRVNSIWGILRSVLEGIIRVVWQY